MVRAAWGILFQIFAFSVTGFGQVGVVYDNHVSTVNNGRVNDPAFPAFLMHADDFSLSATRTVNEVSWLGAYKDGNLLPDGDDNFTIRFFGFNSGIASPTPLATFVVGPVTRFITAQTLSYGNPVYSFSARFQDVQLVAGTYLIAIMNDPLDNDLWLWADADSNPGHSFVMSSPGAAWQEYAGGGVAEFAFSISYVPEPSVSVLMILAGLTFGARRASGSNVSPK